MRFYRTKQKWMFLLCLVALQAITVGAHAQLDTVWGVAQYGGSSNSGTLFYTFPEGGGITKVHDFNLNTEGGHPAADLALYNGVLYGTTTSGGPTGNGTIFSYNQSTGVLTMLHGFDYFGDGAYPAAKLVYDSAMHLFYGLTPQGGENDKGAIFSFDPATNIFTKLFDMDRPTGSGPQGPLTLYKGVLYGLAGGGANNGGVIFSLDPTTNTYTDLYDASGLYAYGQDGGFVVLNNLLYGVAEGGGADYLGILFSFDPVSHAFQDLHDFDDFTGSYPVGITYANGKIYGVTQGFGSVDAYGELFSFDPTSNQLTPLFYLSANTGNYPAGDIIVTGNSLVGTTSSGGQYYNGTVFNYNLQTDNYADVSAFNGSNGSSPTGCQLLLTHVFGTTPQTITFGDLSRKYGDAPFDGGAVASSGLGVQYSSDNPQVAVGHGSTITIVGAGTANITALQAGNPTYDTVSATRTLTVAQVPLLITAGDTTRNQAQPNPVFRTIYTGFVNGDSAGSLTTQPTLTTTADSASSQGTYPITISGAVDPNYIITYQPGVLTVIGFYQTIALPDSVVTYGQPDASPATASSGLPVAYASSNLAVATITADQQIHITGAGTTVITVNQAGNAAYAPQQASFSYQVLPATLTITANDTTGIYLEPYPAFTVQYSGFVYGQDVSLVTTPPVITTTATPTATPGSYVINAGGAVLTPDNYTIVYVSGTLTITPVTGGKQNNLETYFSGPATLQVNVFTVAAQNAVIQLFDVTGRPLLNDPVVLNQGYNPFTLPVTDLPAGIYIVRVAGDSMKLGNKISKQ